MFPSSNPHRPSDRSQKEKLTPATLVESVAYSIQLFKTNWRNLVTIKKLLRQIERLDRLSQAERMNLINDARQVSHDIDKMIQYAGEARSAGV
jgi:hypothetical protein